MKTAWVILSAAMLSGCMVRLPVGCFKAKEEFAIAGFNDQARYTCTVEPQRNVNRCTITDNQSNRVLCQRDFRVQPENRYASEAEFGRLVSFDGENLRVRNGDGREVTLKPLLACKAAD